MSNTLTNTIYSNLLVKKLTKLLSDAQSLADPTGSNGLTSEELTQEVLSGLSNFNKSLVGSTFDPLKDVVGQVPSYDNYIANLKSIKYDLDILFSELEDIGNVILSQFNYIASLYNKLNSQGKTIASDLADYQLLSQYPSQDILVASDSFGSSKKIDIKSSLLSKTECNLSTDEGVVTLPVSNTSSSLIAITELPIINSNSNGTIGNNQQAGATLRGDMSAIIDGAPSTWFEYERVVTVDDYIPLVLDVTINLGSSKVVNFLRINPNNFGTRTSIEILDISTSEGGETFYDVKKDILPDDLTDTTASFSLSPTSSKYAGQCFFTFTPRKAKYIRIKLQQKTSYIIAAKSYSLDQSAFSTISSTQLTSTSAINQAESAGSTGEQRFRYAIGIRDIEVHGIKYKASGEIISNKFSFSDEVKKVAIVSNQIPSSDIDSSIGSITHYISYDDGSSWRKLRPTASAGIGNKQQTTVEILDLNGVSSDTVKTKTSVKDLRWKAVLARNSTGFKTETASDELSTAYKFTEELHQTPTSSPFSFRLNKSPIKDSIQLVDVNYGARGLLGRDYQIGIGTGGKLTIQLPFKIHTEIDKNEYSSFYYEGSSFKGYFREEIEPQILYVDGEEWTNDLGSASSPTDKHYRLDFIRSTIEFGDDTNGQAPLDGAKITMLLEEEKLSFSAGTKHIANLAYPTVADKNDIEVSRVAPVTEVATILGRGKKRHQLQPDIIRWPFYLDVIFSDTDVFDQYCLSESSLTDTGDYTFDPDTGSLISYSFTSSTQDTTVTYYVKPRTELASTDWDFTDNNAIEIKDSAFISWSVEDEPLPPGTTYASLSSLNVVPNSVSFTTSSGVFASGVYYREIPFIDGRTELLGAIQTKEQIESIISPSFPANITRSFSQNISSDTGLEARFTNAYIFQQKVSTTPTSVGEYYVDRGSNQFTVRVYKAYSNAGYVTYYFDDSQTVLTGRYSIDYDLGDIYFHNYTGAADTVSYRYTDYRVRYPISRKVDDGDWSFSAATNKITLKGREIIISQLANKVQTGLPKYYQVSYKYNTSTRTDLAELESYFTPILKGYGLKVITKSRLT